MNTARSPFIVRASRREFLARSVTATGALVSGLSLFSLQAQEAHRNGQPFFESQKLVKRAHEYEHYGWPFLQQLLSGDILADGPKQVATPKDKAVWRDAGRKGNSRYRLRSRDRGRTWTSDRARPGTVLDRSTGEMFTLAPVGTPMLTAEGAPMTEAWMIQHWQKTREMGRRIVLRRSRDGGRTWTERDVTDPFYNYPGEGLAWFVGHGIQLQRGPHAGRLLIPGRFFAGEWKPFDKAGRKSLRHSAGLGWVWEENGRQVSEILNAHACNCVAYSDDHGETWHWGGHSQGHCGESCIVELADGSVYMNNRNHDPASLGYRSWCVSHDGGQNFTEFGVDHTLVEGRCHASLARHSFPEGQNPGRILFLNPAVFDPVQQGSPNRHHLTVRLSYDDGKTWPVAKCLREGPAGYSDMIVLDDGTVLCGFEISAKGFPRDEVMICRFNLEWLES